MPALNSNHFSHKRANSFFINKTVSYCIQVLLIMYKYTSPISDLSLFVPLKTHSQPPPVSVYAMSPPLRGCPYCRVFPDDHAEESALAGSIYDVRYSTGGSLICSVLQPRSLTCRRRRSLTLQCHIVSYTTSSDLRFLSAKLKQCTQLSKPNQAVSKRLSTKPQQEFKN